MASLQGNQSSSSPEKQPQPYTCCLTLQHTAGLERVEQQFDTSIINHITTLKFMQQLKWIMIVDQEK